jgi:hypothetical protein
MKTQSPKKTPITERRDIRKIISEKKEKGIMYRKEKTITFGFTIKKKKGTPL